jgi:hypothetical protein
MVFPQQLHLLSLLAELRQEIFHHAVGRRAISSNLPSQQICRRTPKGEGQLEKKNQKNLNAICCDQRYLNQVYIRGHCLGRQTRAARTQSHDLQSSSRSTYPPLDARTTLCSMPCGTASADHSHNPFSVPNLPSMTLNSEGGAAGPQENSPFTRPQGPLLERSVVPFPDTPV